MIPPSIRLNSTTHVPPSINNEPFTSSLSFSSIFLLLFLFADAVRVSVAGFRFKGREELDESSGGITWAGIEEDVGSHTGAGADLEVADIWPTTTEPM